MHRLERARWAAGPNVAANFLCACGSGSGGATFHPREKRQVRRPPGPEMSPFGLQACVQWLMKVKEPAEVQERARRPTVGADEAREWRGPRMHTPKPLSLFHYRWSGSQESKYGQTDKG